MANATPSRFGSVNAGNDGTFANDYALFLKKFSGEVLTAYEERNIMAPLVMNRTIDNGKTAQFLVTGKAAAAYHVAGTELLGTNQLKHNERTISVDHPLISDTFIANIDEVIAHWDARAEHVVQLARAIAVKNDKNILQLACLAARASATVTGGNGGSILTDAAIETDGEAIYNALFDAQQAMDEKDVPEENRYAVFKPAQFKLLARYTKIHNKDWGGQGTIADGDVGRLAGFQVLKSNHVPTTVINSATGENNTYSGTFTNTMGVCFQREALGFVKWRDLVMESEYQVSRQGHLMLAKMITGAGILRPECSVELKKA